MIDQRFVLLGAALILLGSVSYLTDTIKGRVVPNKVSWFLWAAAPLIAFSAELKHGVGLPSLMTFMVGFGPLLIFLASFVNSKSSWRLTRLDIVCGTFSVLGIILWQITGSGDLAIIFSIIADAVAGVPIFVKSYKEPEAENWHVFFLGAISAGITLLTIDTWDFSHYGFPAYILFIFCILVVLIKFKIGKRL